MTDYIKKPCQHCPFRHDVKPFLHPSRGEELAYATQNPYNSFPCHKTLDRDDEGEACVGAASKDCAGFLTMMAGQMGDEYTPDGFEPSYELCYSEPYDMAVAYEEEWKAR